MPSYKPVPEVDELVTLIYRGALEETPWQGFLEALSRRMQRQSAAITLRLSRPGMPPFIIWAPPPPIAEQDARRIHRIHAELGDLDPLRNALARPGDIYRLSEIVAAEALHASRFYAEILQPYGIEYQLGMYISEPGGWEGNVGLTDGPGGEDFSDNDKAMLIALRPHLELSLALFARIRREETEAQAMIDTLDRLTLCTFILDGAGRILRSNGAGRALARANKGLRTAGERLMLANQSDNAQLQKLIGNAIAAHRDGGSFAEGLRVEADFHGHLGILIRSIEAHSHYGNEAGPAAIVYVSGLDTHHPLERLVAQIFDLTPSEAQLAAQLASGLSLSEAAERLGFTENTVRSYCKTILNKTGVGRQADLVRLILRSVAVLG